MSDKELIKQEIKRRIVQAEEFAERAEGANDEPSKLSWDFVATQNKSLLQFIESLPEEPASEDLEKEIGKYTTNHLLKKRNHSTGVYHLTQKDCDDIARHFAEWQKQKDKQLVGATQKVSHQHGYDEGRADMREEMMKDAINCSIIMHPNDRFANYSVSAYVPPLHPASTYISNGEKVKIIIVKEE